MTNIAIIGATGNVGRKTLEVIEKILFTSLQAWCFTLRPAGLRLKEIKFFYNLQKSKFLDTLTVE